MVGSNSGPFGGRRLTVVVVPDWVAACQLGGV